ncbi:MAG: L-aspartate oxidase [bacterium]|nr:L-aspartate oxidase [bacterium]
MQVLDFDFVIVGSGIAGLSAAKGLAKAGRVAILTKGAIRGGGSSTHWAQGGVAAAIQEGDTPDLHFNDTIEAGAGLCDEKMVRILVEEGPDRVRELIELGADFDKVDGQLHYTQEGAHSKRRILHAGDATGREIEKTLGRYLLTETLVQFFPHTSILDLIIENGHCVGIQAKHKTDDVMFRAKVVILATGGACQMYARNTNPPSSTGDGVALAYWAGCQVKDLEFVQFHPTTLALGDKKPISLFLISEAVRGEGGILRNSAGKRFMPEYHALAELAPRDVVSRAIFKEMMDAGTSQVYLDLSNITVDIPKRFPTIFERCMEAKIDIRKQFIPVAPAAHYCIGGVVVDEWGRTDVDGLYAVGEVTATGIHGANRLASNSLLEGMVFGARVAEAVMGSPALKMGSVRGHSDDRVRLPGSRIKSGMTAGESEGITAGEVRELCAVPTDSDLMIVRHSVQNAMWEYVGIERNAAGLRRALGILGLHADVLQMPHDTELILEVKSLLQLAILTTEMALARCESVGAHFRSDFAHISKKRDVLI